VANLGMQPTTSRVIMSAAAADAQRPKDAECRSKRLIRLRMLRWSDSRPGIAALWRHALKGMTPTFFSTPVPMGAPTSTESIVRGTMVAGLKVARGMGRAGRRPGRMNCSAHWSSGVKPPQVQTWFVPGLKVLQSRSQ